MKKIMTTALVALVGLASNAAAIAWDNSDGDLYGYATGDMATDYIVYFVDASALSQADALGFLSAGKVADVTAKGTAGLLADGGWVEGEADGFAAGTTVTGYLVAFNASSAADATYAYVSDTIDVSLPSSGMAAFGSFDLSGSETASNWQAVPEPTSGLLLLLGVAGLALKRKRA